MNIKWRVLYGSLLISLVCQISSSCSENRSVNGVNEAAQPEARAQQWWHMRYQENHQIVSNDKDRIKLIFMGDSITEGMSIASDVMKKYWGDYGPVNLGIGGDFTQHLLWRIQHGEIDGVEPKVIVVLIGTNNLNDHSDEQTVDGILAVIRELRARKPGAKVLTLALLPRSQEPDNIYRKRVNGVNALLAKQIPPDVSFADVGPSLVQPDGRIDPAVMPDFLHLSHKGYEILFGAIKPHVDKHLGESTPAR